MLILKLQAVFGILVFLSFCWLISSDRKNIDYSQIAIGIGLQFFIALIVTNVSLVQTAFNYLNNGIMAVSEATRNGTAFVFGYLGGAPLPFTVAPEHESRLFILAFQSLPVVMVMSSLTSVLFYWQVIPVITKFLSKILERTLGIGGALGLSSASTVFFGTDVAALLVKPHLKHMSRSELFTLMSCGMATVASSIMLLYTQILQPVFNSSGVALGHIITASFINVPSALVVALIMMPQVGKTTGGHLVIADKPHSTMDAVTRGVSDGLNIVLNITSMLVVLTALVYIVNNCLSVINIFDQPITLQKIFGLIFSPIAWLMGIPWSEVSIAGSLMGTKVVLNEIFAYQQLVAEMGNISQHTQLIMVYALCGFANFTSVGIIIGALSILIPERRSEVVDLSLKAIVSGALANCITGTIIGILT
ncbi:MAG: nucleoside:proton symporter [Gammaproteobacteria bacterium]|nr:nucleoside:proton symporter [Gammaproteobacteria bacterium]